MEFPSERGKFPGKPSSSEKPNFAQTCNLLSQYFKEKRANLGDKDHVSADLPANRSEPSTMNFLAGMGSDNAAASTTPTNVNSNDFLKRKTAPTISSEDDNGQMTIFYRGHVHVFNDFPVDKAKEVVALAAAGVSSSSKTMITPVKPTAAGGESSANPQQQHQLQLQHHQDHQQQRQLQHHQDKQQQRQLQLQHHQDQQQQQLQLQHHQDKQQQRQLQLQHHQDQQQQQLQLQLQHHQDKQQQRQLQLQHHQDQQQQQQKQHGLHQPRQAEASELSQPTRASLHRFFAKRKDRALARESNRVNPVPAPVTEESPKPEEKNKAESSARSFDLNL